MKFLVFGSLNIDMVYSLDHIVAPGETIAVNNFATHAGGKGANQAAALGRAGMPVFMAGKMGTDGEFLLKKLEQCGVDVSLVSHDDGASGHAIIQVAADGENAICIYPGANRRITEAEVDAVLEHFSAGDVLLLQNEINQLDCIIRRAAARGMIVALNPAPFTNDITSLPLDKLTLLIVNEVEAEQMTGISAFGSADTLLNAIMEKMPRCNVVLTLGSRGAVFMANDGHRVFAAAKKVRPVDTTGAGDTFIGYFMAKFASGAAPEKCLDYGCQAAALAVTRHGAMDSIPAAAEL